MRKEDKAIIIEKIASTLKEYSCFYLTDTTGMDAEQTSALRRACFNADVKMVVVKNTLLHKALEQLEGDYSDLYPALTGKLPQCCSPMSATHRQRQSRTSTRKVQNFLS